MWNCGYRRIHIPSLTESVSLGTIYKVIIKLQCVQSGILSITEVFTGNISHTVWEIEVTYLNINIGFLPVLALWVTCILHFSKSE